MTDQQLAARQSVTASAPFASFASLELSEAERSVTDALMSCIARWGLNKTTIEDIAHETGVSRATVYRLFPGGKNSIVYLAVTAQVQILINQLIEELDPLDDLEDSLTVALHHSAMFLDSHPALSYMREYESAQFEQIMSFERMDLVLASCGAALAPLFSDFLPAESTFDVGMWGARLLVSYLTEESQYLDLLDPDDVRRLVQTFIIPGLCADGPLDSEVQSQTQISGTH